jgi:hypothetical protein
VTDRYWNPTDPPEALFEWVNKEVIDAMSDLINEGTCYIGIKNNKLNITFSSFEKPEVEGEVTDVWGKSFDLHDMVTIWALEYRGVQHLTDADRKDLEYRANLLDELAREFRRVAGIPSNNSQEK